ncbi:MAG TPA: helix-turn-helix transcriptional regulator [Gemmatimonadaceae bacterium]|nr:helix-turn-helix transcriptional regulator [Gemmatimonadaceae bacterium]
MDIVCFRLHELIHEKGTSERALARRWRQLTTISGVSEREAQVSLETMGRLARALGDDVEAGDLMEFTAEPRGGKRSR